MSKPKHFAGYIKEIGDPTTIRAEHWQPIITAYAQDLPKTVKAKISARTALFSAAMQGESNSITSKELLEELRKFHKSALSARTKIFGTSAVTRRASTKKGSLEDKRNVVLKLYESGNDIRESYGDYLYLLEHTLDLAIATSEYLPEAMADNDLGAERGWLWEAWVRSVRNTLMEYGLPHTVRKDVDAWGKPSHFVLLIKEIQNLMPVICRRFTTSDVALSQGIWRCIKNKKMGGFSTGQEAKKILAQ